MPVLRVPMHSLAILGWPRQPNLLGTTKLELRKLFAFKLALEGWRHWFEGVEWKRVGRGLYHKSFPFGLLLSSLIPSWISLSHLPCLQ